MQDWELEKTFTVTSSGGRVGGEGVGTDTHTDTHRVFFYYFCSPPCFLGSNNNPEFSVRHLELMDYVLYICNICLTKASKSSRKLPEGKNSLSSHLQPNWGMEVASNLPALHSGLSDSAVSRWH